MIKYNYFDGQIWPAGSCVFVLAWPTISRTHPYFLLFFFLHPYFLTQDIPGSSCIFPASRLEFFFFSPETLDSFGAEQ